MASSSVRSSKRNIRSTDIAPDPATRATPRGADQAARSGVGADGGVRPLRFAREAVRWRNSSDLEQLNIPEPMCMCGRRGPPKAGQPPSRRARAPRSAAARPAAQLAQQPLRLGRVGREIDELLGE